MFEDVLVWKGNTEKEKHENTGKKAGRDVKIALPFYIEK